MKDKFKSGASAVKRMATTPEQLAGQIFDALIPLLPTYYKWDALSYDERKGFVRDAIDLLLARFGDEKLRPMVLFREDLSAMLKPGMSLPPKTGAFCYVAGHSKRNDDYVAALCQNPPRAAFGFLHDLSGPGMIGQIAHEFTHFLQHAGKSCLDLGQMQAVWDNYVRPEEDMAAYKNQSVEREAVIVGDAVRNMAWKYRETMMAKGNQND